MPGWSGKFSIVVAAALLVSVSAPFAKYSLVAAKPVRSMVSPAARPVIALIAVSPAALPDTLHGEPCRIAGWRNW